MTTAPGCWHAQNMGCTVLVVDDSRAFAAVACESLRLGGFSVVGVAIDGGEALRMAEELAPDVVVLDIGLPDLDGFEVATRLTAGDDAPSVVLTSSRDWADLARRIGESGAVGFLPKDELDGPTVEALVRSGGWHR